VPLRAADEMLGLALLPSEVRSLRHIYISRLIMAGADVRTVQELAGHKTIGMTVRYAHLAPEHKRRVTGLLDVEVTGKVTTVDFTQALPIGVSHVQ
jgi:site-specific recombinase XerC